MTNEQINVIFNSMASIFDRIDSINVPYLGCSLLEMFIGMIFIECIYSFFLPWIDYGEVEDI